MPGEQANSFAGQRILVTGASSGLGHHIATALHARGARVVLAARRLSALEELAEHLGEGAETCVLDVTDPSSVTSAFESLTASGGRLDGLVNNSGVADTTRLIDASVEAFDRVMATNLRGAFLVAQAFARHVIPSGYRAAIVNIASTLGLKPLPGVATYAVSKAGLIHLTKCMALEWGPKGIRTNAICPGYIETDLNRSFFASDAGRKLIATFPQRRLGQPDDLVGLTAYLLSPEAGLINGAVIAADDGYHLT